MTIIMTTFQSREDALKVGKLLLEKRYLAGYNLWPVDSANWWEGEIVQRPEIVMLLKSKDRWYEDIFDTIKAETGYEVPEVSSWTMERVGPTYQRWINEEVA